MSKTHIAIDAVTGAGHIPQDIADAALEIALAETEAELLAAAKRYQNFVLIAARGQMMNQKARAAA